MGHPSRREFFKVLNAAHAKPVVLEYVRRGYRCADCDAHSRPQPSRKAAEQRTYEFNSIIALDVFYTHLRGQSLSLLNIICHGTNFQVAALLQQDGTPPAAVVWFTFQRSWRRYFGTPDDITRTVVRSAAEISHNPGNMLAFCRQSSTLMRPGRTVSAKDTGDSLSEGTRDRGSFHA